MNKRELIMLVWHDTFVDESNLKVNIAAIRRVIDDRCASRSRIATVIGRGYRFVEPVQEFSMDEPDHRSKEQDSLPVCFGRLIRYHRIASQLAVRLAARRLVAFVGGTHAGSVSLRRNMLKRMLRRSADPFDRHAGWRAKRKHRRQQSTRARRLFT